MKPSRARLLIGFFVSAAILIVLGIILQSLILQWTTPKARSDNALLGGIPFIFIFVGIIVAFIGSITLLATLINHKISAALYHPILNLFIAGIVLGVVGIFQPFLFVLYQIGFWMLLISVIGYIVWSHIVPRAVRRQEKVGGAPASQ
jgi:hypothetical protein